MPGDAILVPFLKWAGGKRWLVARYPDLFPTSFDGYLEPFLGSGAVYFHLRPGQAVLADLNPDLIETYTAIKQNWSLVRKHLLRHHRNHSRGYYYSTRSKVPSSSCARAARLIYLNRTCWNALYRVNKRGEFNVPIGTKSAVILPTDDFDATSRALATADLRHDDFAIIVDMAGRGDFVFVDPPYTVKHNYNGFIKYNEQIFSWSDQERLRDVLLAAGRRGAKVLMTNADHSSIWALYRRDFKVSRVCRSSVIAASSSKRAMVTELLIRNY